MTIKITIPNTSSDTLTFGSANTPTAAQIAGIDSGSSSGQLALYTTASGTSTERVRVDASGNVGIGTSSPTYRLHVANSGFPAVGVFRDLDVTSVGTAGQGIELGARNGATFTPGASIVGDLDNPATTGVLRFLTRSSSTLSERARITSSGNLLVNATAAVTNVQEAIGAIALGSTGPAASFKNSAGATAAAIECWNSATSGDNRFITFTTDGYVTRGSITYNRAGGLVAYNTTSDYRAKTVNGLVQNALSKVALLKPSTGRMNGAEQDIDFFVAHELQEVVPSAVTGDKDAVMEDGSPNYQMVDKSALIPLLTAAIQEQQAIIQTLTDRITALENK